MATSCERFFCDGPTTGICGNVDEINHQLGYFTKKEEEEKFIGGFEVFLTRMLDTVYPECAYKTQLAPAIRNGALKFEEIKGKPFRPNLEDALKTDTV